MLLDTCALLWLAQGGGKLSAEVCKQINDEAVVYGSAIKGKLDLTFLFTWFILLPVYAFTWLTSFLLSY